MGDAESPQRPEDVASGFSPPLPAPLEDLRSPAWQLDAKGAVVGANRGARRLEHAAARALPLRTPGERHVLDERGELRRALLEGRPLEVCAHGPSGEPVRLVLEPLRDAGGSPAGGLLVVAETTRSGRSRSLLARLMDSIVREMGGPVGSLRSLRDLGHTAADSGDAERALLYLVRLDRHVGRLEEVLEELRELLEVLSADIPLRPAAVDLVALVRGAVDAASTTCHDRVFEISLPDEAPAVTDPDRIRRVLAVLLSNAVRFSPLGGRIEVGVEMTRDSVALSVRDHGGGIPGDRLASLFDGPCWNQEVPTGGLGLGLFLAREMVERMGGSMTADAAEGGGTRVALRLPRVLRERSPGGS